ncbi:MAG: conjugal transfer protein [Oscillospiraceae bacterium]|nr:conjugal transfer protein [Oscillospiraceae bacterium]
MRLFSYEKAWKIEHKIYAIQNLRLPVPVSLHALAYFSITCAAVFSLSKFLPVLTNIPPILLYGALPYLVTGFLRKKKFDGKPPHIFAKDYIMFIVQKHTNVEFFRAANHHGNGRAKFSWYCTHRAV